MWGGKCEIFAPTWAIGIVSNFLRIFIFVTYLPILPPHLFCYEIINSFTFLLMYMCLPNGPKCLKVSLHYGHAMFRPAHMSAYSCRFPFIASFVNSLCAHVAHMSCLRKSSISPENSYYVIRQP